MPTMRELGLDKLSADERRALADELRASVEAPYVPGMHLTDADKAMLRERLADIAANPDDSVPAEEVIAGARARLERRGQS